MKRKITKREFEGLLIDTVGLSSLSKRNHYERKAGVEQGVEWFGSEHWEQQPIPQISPKDYVKLTLYYKDGDHCATWQSGRGSIPKWSSIHGEVK